METKNSVNRQINEITNEIQEEYPELYKYLLEMPVTIPNVNEPTINLDRLKEYYKSLVELRNKYANEHTK